MHEFASSIVFVSRNPDLHRAMFDAPTLFESFDLNQSMIVGPVGNFSYSSGLCSFSIHPDRVVLSQKSSELFPPPLVRAADQIASDIHNHFPQHSISGIGMNMDTNFDTQSDFSRVQEVCEKFVNIDTVVDLFGKQVERTYPRWFIVDEHLQYHINVHPIVTDDTSWLTLNVNVHQDVTGEEQLETKLSSLNKVRRRLKHFHEHLLLKFTERR